MTKEVFIRNPARQINTHQAHENYVPEYVRLIAEGKLAGAPKESELLEHQAKIRAQAIKDLQMAPKITVPAVGQQDLGWNKKAVFFDEPLMEAPVYDESLEEQDVNNYNLDSVRQRIHKERETKQDNHKSEKRSGSSYNPPNSLDQLSNNEIIIIVQNKVVFSSLEETDIKSKLASLIFEENINPDEILVIKRLPIHISIDLS